MDNKRMASEVPTSELCTLVTGRLLPVRDIFTNEEAGYKIQLINALVLPKFSRSFPHIVCCIKHIKMLKGHP